MLIETIQTRQNRAAPPSLARLCADLESIAVRLKLPGKGGPAVASAAPSRVGAGGEEKTPHPAHSPDVLQVAADELPNDPGGRFHTYAEWVEGIHAFKGASVAGGFEAEGFAIAEKWSAKWGGDPDETRRVWDSIKTPHIGFGWIMRTLRAVNPAGADRVKAAENLAVQAQSAAQTHAAIVGATFAPVAPFLASQIPPRRWLYGRAAIAGFLSFLVAPGGAGKSALAMVEAVAMASGRELLPGEKPVRTLRVWVLNAEDDMAEMDRRLAAVLQHFGVTYADLGGNLFMTSGRDMKLQLARVGRDGPEIVPGVVDALVERLVTAKIDVLILDPLGALHTLPENSNEAANLLSGALREVAHRADAAVVVLHHAGKAAAMDMDSAGAGASRGASAFVDAARVVRQVVRMTVDEARDLGIAEADRRDYLRVENGKANLARAEGGRWLRMVDVPLGNGMGLWPLGDRVGVVERWTPPASQPGTGADLARVQAALSASPRPPRAHSLSPDWVGWLVGTVMGLDTGGPATPKEDRTPAQNAALARIRRIVAGWVQSGGLVEREEKDPDSRKLFKFVYVGKPAVLIEDTDPETDVEDPAEQGAAENAE